MTTLRQSLRELAEDFATMTSGGKYSNDLQPDFQVVEKQLIKLRGQAIRTLFMPYEGRAVARTTRMNRFWCLSVKLKKDAANQDTFGDLKYAYAKFPIPPVVQINNEIDGFISVSSANHSNMYYRLSSFSQWMQKLRSGDCIKKKYWWYDDGAICTNDLAVQYLLPHACPEDPTEWVTWNESTSSYDLAYNPDTQPFLVTTDVIGIMSDMWQQGYMRNPKPADIFNNGTPPNNEQQKLANA